jgi:antitoxin VapB
MTQSAKIFINGRSQAVRLPAAYRFDCKEVFIRKDPKTGDVILSSKPNNWDDYLALAKKIEVPDDFMADREDSLPQERDILND